MSTRFLAYNHEISNHVYIVDTADTNLVYHLPFPISFQERSTGPGVLIEVSYLSATSCASSGWLLPVKSFIELLAIVRGVVDSGVRDQNRSQRGG